MRCLLLQNSYWFHYQTSETVFKIVNINFLSFFLVIYYDFISHLESHSESEPGISNFAINLASDFDSTSDSKSKSESESDFNSSFMNLGICVICVI